MITIALTLAPSLAIMIYVYWKDKFEKEPLGLLIKCFFMGVLSTMVTLLLSMPTKNLFPNLFLEVYVGIALIEEFSKYIFVRWVAYPNKAFNEPYDGITYSVMVSMGFATLENILYVAEGGLGVAVMRMFTAVPAHATFAVCMGYFVGLAKFNPKNSFLYLTMGLLSATILHGTYDYCLFEKNIPAIALGALASLIIGVILSLKAIRLHNSRSPFNPNNTGNQ